MKVRFIALIVASVLSIASPVSAARTHHHRPVVPWSTWQKVLRVHVCEEPRWNVVGSVYSGGLGWRNALWAQFRAPWMPANMGYASPLQQAWAMAHFIKVDNGGFWPDQLWCAGGY